MSAAEATDTMRKALPELAIYLAGSAEYDERNNSYLSSFESDLLPASIIAPKSATKLSTMFKTLEPFIKDGKVPLAIRGGGQQPAPGCANTHGGITLDLHLLKGISLADGVVSIAAGERWGAVYDKLDEAGLAVTGSRAATGGIGGLALTGGHSYFTSREGWICDNVLRYEIVLANGDIITASASTNSDLWRALKGGANNFGVVTRYDMRTFPQGKIWGGSVYYFATHFPDQIKAMVKEITSPAPDKDVHLMLSIGYAAQFGQTVCQNCVYYPKEVENPPVLEPFCPIDESLKAMNTLRLASLRQMTEEQSGLTKYGQRVAYMTTTLKANVSVHQKATDIYTSAIEDIKPFEGLIASLTFEPLPISTLQKTEELGGNSLGLSPSDGPLIVVLILTYWKDRKDDEAVLGTMRDVIRGIDGEAEAKGLGSQFRYANYSWKGDDPMASYGEEERKRLRAVSSKYDPDGVFQKVVSGGFKLS